MKPYFKKFAALLLLLQTMGMAQTNLNQYKYVSVPDRFDFLKTTDQYQLVSLTKFLLTKNGFTVLESLENYPYDLSLNRCLSLNVNVEKIKGFLKTKLEIQFINCKKEVVYRSTIGSSKEKDFRTAYHQALRAAFASLSELNYNFKAVKTEVAVKQAPIFTKVSTEPAPATVVTKVVLPAARGEVSEISMVKTIYGHDIMDAKGQVLYSLHQTMQEGLFIIDKLTGIVYKRGNRWVREYIVNQKTVIEALIP